MDATTLPLNSPVFTEEKESTKNDFVNAFNLNLATFIGGWDLHLKLPARLTNPLYGREEDEIERVNQAETLDEIINEARLDYAIGNYKTFTNAKDLIAELHA